MTLFSLIALVGGCAVFESGSSGGSGGGSSKVVGNPSAGISAKPGGGPPPWAPAHGYRDKVQYRYYPDHDVYYNTDRKEYTWREGNKWHHDRQLPDNHKLKGHESHHDHHMVEVEGDRPEHYHDKIHDHFRRGAGRLPAQGLPGGPPQRVPRRLP
jgi:hypothetical protein